MKKEHARAAPYQIRPLDDGRRRFSCYVPMRDGVLIAITAWLPSEEVSGPYRTIVNFTRYWRERRYDGPAPSVINPGNEIPVWNAWGYVIINVDVRGTGASFGTRSVETPANEVADYAEVIDWIAAQPWSDGNVATMGISYGANAAILAAIRPSPALKAVIARYVEIDAYQDLIAPGGAPNAMFLGDWGRYVACLDRNDPSGFLLTGGKGAPIIGIVPVDNDEDGEMLAAAVRDHKANYYVPEAIMRAAEEPLVRDQFILPIDDEGAVDIGPTIIGNLDAIDRQNIPIMIWASWMDAGVGAGAIRWFRQAKGPGVAIIGAWSHGGGETADPYAQPYGPTEPDHAEKMRMIRDFLDQAMAPEPEEPQRRLIRYVTLGTNAWNETDIWPPADISPSVLFLGDEGRLLPEPADAKTSCDAYEADFNIGSGVETRWTTQLGKPVAYPDQGDGAGWLCYETPALAEDVEITGTPALDLYISSTHEDVMALCHMDEIAPDGRATYLTEGVLRLMHRADLVDDMRLIAGDDIRSFLGDDLRPLEAGAEERFQFPLLPISVVIRKGHKLRFRFAGADKDTFVRIPAVGDPILTFHRDTGKRSRIILPVKGNGKEAFR